MRPDLPTGTVTFLFTDVEGSTRLLHEAGSDAYAQALAEHRRVVREACAAHGGIEVDTQGDAFLIVFPRAADAIAAAAVAQRQLAANEWPQGKPLRVRMGVHTGEPAATAEGYVGLDVHRAARICAAAHGGQVLVSSTTRELLTAAEGFAVRDLGEHRLKDLTYAQRLFQLLLPELEQHFPPPRTLENRPTNLPTQSTPLIGRERELSEVIDLLRRDGVRLVTLSGPGGTGKTRLALQAAAELVDSFPDGVWFVNLAALTDPTLVLPTIAQALSVREQPGEAITETLANFLREQHVLLLLDNFEQVTQAAIDIAVVLSSAPSTTLLVTSRAALHLSGEHEYAVAPLADEEAVTLFTERAQAAKATFSLNGNRGVVLEICRRLDNLPLALELAAARIKLLPENVLLERLSERLKLLSGGARDLPERQQTLRAAIDWSYTLLSDPEQELFARLSVFAGGRTLDAIEAVCDPDGELDLDLLDGLGSLIDKSLLRQEEGPGGEARFVMLETIHEYARERLAERDEGETVATRHAYHFLMLAERAPGSIAETSSWVERLAAELDNVRTALEFLNRGGDVESHLRLTGALWRFWYLRGHLAEGRSRLDEALASADDRHGLPRERALYGLAALAYYAGDYGKAIAACEEALALARGRGDEVEIARRLTGLAVACVGAGHHEQALVFGAQALERARELAHADLEANALLNLSNALLNLGDHNQARANGEEALGLFRQIGDAEGEAVALQNLGWLQLDLGSPREARSLYEASLACCRSLGHRVGIAFALEGIAAVSTVEGEAWTAARLLGAAARLLEESGARRQHAEQALYERTIQNLRVELSDEEMETFVSEGRGLPDEEVIALGLRELKQASP